MIKKHPAAWASLAEVISHELQGLHRASSLLACIVALQEHGREVDVIDPVNTARAHIDHAIEALQVMLQAQGRAASSSAKGPLKH